MSFVLLKTNNETEILRLNRSVKLWAAKTMSCCKDFDEAQANHMIKINMSSERKGSVVRLITLPNGPNWFRYCQCLNSTNETKP
jgi:hypothetical protein